MPFIYCLLSEGLRFAVAAALAYAVSDFASERINHEFQIVLEFLRDIS